MRFGYLLCTISIIAVLSLLAGCGSRATELTGARRDAVLSYAEPVVDNLVAAYNRNDYAAFSRDFDINLRTGISADNFPQSRSFLIDHLGQYRSRQVASVQQQDTLITVVYQAQFEKSKDATIRAVFESAATADDKHLLSGIWFDAPELKQ